MAQVVTDTRVLWTPPEHHLVPTLTLTLTHSHSHTQRPGLHTHTLTHTHTQRPGPHTHTLTLTHTHTHRDDTEATYTARSPRQGAPRGRGRHQAGRRPSSRIAQSHSATSPSGASTRLSTFTTADTSDPTETNGILRATLRQTSCRQAVQLHSFT